MTNKELIDKVRALWVQWGGMPMFVEELDKIEEALPPEDRLTTKAVLNAMQDHYWDSLEPNRDIVMKHVEGVLRLFEQSHMNKEPQ
jgi:hypothetical protein